ncbi:cation:proton antiporter [Methylotetracoccus oryzae]|uniref:cation:proton antiporter n=1 Tax=Methylotetracoccus oryzae TaxID=1919059 RepID=UPI00191499B0|nr:sodium:proton antiporter [Methylotetracoccus oryzae]
MTAETGGSLGGHPLPLASSQSHKALCRMNLIHILSLLVVLAAAFSYVNHRWLRWPSTIGLMVLSMTLSLGLLVVGTWLPEVEESVRTMLHRLQFDKFMMEWILSFLLFAGALHVSIEDLLRQKWEVAVLATISVVLSTFLVGVLSWWVLNHLGFGTPLIWCLLFGALISPTDPIAVLGILKTAKAPKSLETIIAGESLFNDGMGVTMFSLLLGLATGRRAIDLEGVSVLFLEEVAGGVAFGLVLGWLGVRLVRTADDFNVELMITVAMAMGGYTLASALGTSGPIAIVVAGLVLGNHGHHLQTMAPRNRLYLDHFWEFVDEALNGILFVLIGLELLVLVSRGEHALAVLGVIPMVLLSRLISVGLPIGLMRRFRRFPKKVVQTLTWGGLRGGVSVALALSLPAGAEREVILHLTYGVVVFSIIVQGMTVGRFVRTESA